MGHSFFSIRSQMMLDVVSTGLLYVWINSLVFPCYPCSTHEDCLAVPHVPNLSIPSHPITWYMMMTILSMNNKMLDVMHKVKEGQ